MVTATIATNLPYELPTNAFDIGGYKKENWNSKGPQLA